MPAPQASMMQNLAKLKFSSNALKVPTNWQQPQGDPAAKHYAGQAFKDDEKAVAPDTMAPPLFLPASVNKYHVDTQKKLNSQFKDYIEGICSAICSAWSTWQSAAVLTGVLINGPTAAGGAVVGPPWTPLIMAQGPMTTPMLMKYTNVIAQVIGMGWQQYTLTIKVAGLPWYPAFAAFPGPVTPPTPNIPANLMMLTQVPVSISPALMKQQMVGQLADPKAPFHQELFDCITDAFDKCFQIWQKSTMVTNVLGFGPVPTFAPPYVPVGPVVGGVGNMTPGGFV